MKVSKHIRGFGNKNALPMYYVPVEQETIYQFPYYPFFLDVFPFIHLSRTFLPL